MLWNMYLPKDAQWVKKGSKNTADDINVPTLSGFGIVLKKIA